jgi:hypothetical protein
MISDNNKNLGKNKQKIKIYFLKEQRRIETNKRKVSLTPALAHLSSLIQTEKKNGIS